MARKRSSSSSAPFIKGYLPVRLSLQFSAYSSDNDNEFDETFFFVKEHFASDRATLFVANVPSIPVVSSKILLTSIFAKFGIVKRVTVVPNPRTIKPDDEDGRKQDAGTSGGDGLSSSSCSSSWSTKHRNPSFLGPVYSEGRFAHVVFASTKEMKKSLRALVDIMSSSSSSSKPTKRNDASLLPGLSLERIEIQTLQEETKRQKASTCENDDADDQQIEEEETEKGIVKVAKRYRASCRALSRASLLEECNAIMEQYEHDEEQDKRKRETAKSGEPDEDGFITVSYTSSKSSIGSKRELEQAGQHHHRRKGSKRSRKKKDTTKGLTDFYRFQTKESRKQHLQDLRKRFEQDLAKVKKMKEERQYRPF